MNHYNFLMEVEQQIPVDDPTIDPNANAEVDLNQQVQNDQPEQSFEPLIKSAADIPHSRDRAEVLKIAAQIREIEAKTKETLAKAEQPQMDPNMTATDPSMGDGQIDPATGMPIDSNMGAQIDPMTGQPIMDPNMTVQQQNDPLKGLGDASAPQDSMGGMGAVDPMTGQPTNEPSKTFTAVGRAYKLKNIYQILDNISRLLHISSDTKLQELYKEVDTAFDLFRLVVNNLKIYKDKVDDLIVLYYALLKDICVKIEDIYKQRKLECSLNEARLFKRTFNLVNEGIEG